MGVRIEWSVRATRQLLKLEQLEQQRICKAVGRLTGFPMAAGIKRLTNHDPPFRLRVRNHRVLFSFDGTRQLILIEAIRKRDEHTY